MKSRVQLFLLSQNILHEAKPTWPCQWCSCAWEIFQVLQVPLRLVVCGQYELSSQNCAREEETSGEMVCMSVMWLPHTLSLVLGCPYIGGSYKPPTVSVRACWMYFWNQLCTSAEETFSNSWARSGTTVCCTVQCSFAGCDFRRRSTREMRLHERRHVTSHKFISDAKSVRTSLAIRIRIKAGESENFGTDANSDTNVRGYSNSNSNSGTYREPIFDSNSIHIDT